MGKIKINIDSSKCTNPKNCLKCINICQPEVLLLTFDDEDYHNPKDWRIFPIFPGLCTNCKLCVELCPEKAISIKYN